MNTRHMPKTILLTLAIVAPLSPAFAQSSLANAPITPEEQYPGAAVAAAAARAQREPGVTHEFSPDSRQTATGGPSGGIPNQSGGP